MIFDVRKLKNLRHETPFFVFSKEALLNNLREYQRYLPRRTEICYAMKANSEKIVLQHLHNAGVSFEVASKYELALSKEIEVPAERIVYGTSVKPESHIKEFTRYGVDRFAFDSEQELLKIANVAPGSRVYIRMLVNAKSNSVFELSKKFGATADEAAALLLRAKEVGLVPYGMSFNVGSQARSEQAWARGIKDMARAMESLLKNNLKIQVINIGGGFPHSYRNNDGFSRLSGISKHIHGAIKESPYTVSYIAEPGRGLVANTYVLITTVIGKRKRSNGHWLSIDAGVYNALLEAMTCQGTTRYRIELLSAKRKLRNQEERFIVTGPTGDSLDVVSEEELLPADIDVGDKLLIHDVGAYTFPLITRFNGFPKPRVFTF